MEPKELEEIGFSKNEAKIYLSLLQRGPTQAGQISKSTQINRRTTYDTLERLIEKGYVSYDIVANKRVFHAVSPTAVMSKINEVSEKTKKLTPQLMQIYNESKPEQEATTYKGRKGIRSILQQLLQVKEYVGFGSNEKFPEVMTHDFHLFQKIKREKRIKSRTLMSESMRGNAVLKAAYTQYKFIHDILSQPTSTFVYGDKVAIIVWSDVPIGLVIENKVLAKTYLDYFEKLWATAKK